MALAGWDHLCPGQPRPAWAFGPYITFNGAHCGSSLTLFQISQVFTYFRIYVGDTRVNKLAVIALIFLDLFHTAVSWALFQPKSN